MGVTSRVRMVGVTYRSASARPANKANNFVFPPPQQDVKIERGPAPSFKDKESYQGLFKPLPKPEPIPALVPFKVEAKSWKQLQEERESLMQMQLDKTKIDADKKRIEDEARAREEILRRGDEERIAMDKARKDELRRQEEILTGRKIRSKTTDLSVDDIRGAGIQIFH